MCSSTDKEAGRPADGFSEPPFDGGAPADTPAARVALKVPHPESLVEVRLTPPDSHFEVKVSPDGQTVELLIHPGAGLISLRLSPPEEVPPKAAAREPGLGANRPLERGPAQAAFTIPTEDVLRLFMVRPAGPSPEEASAVQPPAVQPPAVQPPEVQPPAVQPPEVQLPEAQLPEAQLPEVPPPEALGGPAQAEFTVPTEDLMRLVMVQPDGPNPEEADEIPPPEVLGGPASEAELRQPPDAGLKAAGPTEPDERPAEAGAAPEAAESAGESPAATEPPPAGDREAAPLGELYARDPDSDEAPPNGPSDAPPAVANDPGMASFKGMNPYDPDFDEAPPGGLFSASPAAAAGGKTAADSEELEEILPIEEEAAGSADGAPAPLAAAVQDEPLKLELAEVGRRPAAPADEDEPAPPQDGPGNGARPTRGAR
jgi:hypothetical protein